MATKTTKAKTTAVEIRAPNMEIVELEIVGTAPYVQHKFSEKARKAMLETQRMTGAKNKGRKKEPRISAKEEMENGIHYAEEGWVSIPAAAFRAAMIDVCRLVGYKMTMAKMTVFIEPDGFDQDDGTPLVKLKAGKPETAEHSCRLESGVASVTIRPMWRKWGAKVRVQFDADQFTVADVTNLMARVGMQAGIGEGRHYSKKSIGMGWGTFVLK